MLKNLPRVITLILLASILLSNQQVTLVSSTGVGPWIGSLEFKIITQDDQLVNALQACEIDLIGDTIDPSFLEMLEREESVQLTHSMYNGYGYLTINTNKYPLNITALR